MAEDICGPCAEYQRGERKDSDVGGISVHICEHIDLISPGANAVVITACPCGCELASKLASDDPIGSSARHSSWLNDLADQEAIERAYVAALPQIHWVCLGCGRNADWTGFRKSCGACGSRDRDEWLFRPSSRTTS